MPPGEGRKEDKAMTNIYRLNKLHTEELEKVVGGSFKDIVRRIGCILGTCDYSNCLTVGQKKGVNQFGQQCTYTKYKCLTCGCYHYYRLTESSPGNGWVDTISEETYNNAPTSGNMLTI